MFKMEPETNAEAGEHLVEFTLDDSISVPSVFSFKATIGRNEFLIPLGTIEDCFAVANQPFDFFIDAENLF